MGVPGDAVQIVEVELAWLGGEPLVKPGGHGALPPGADPARPRVARTAGLADKRPPVVPCTTTVMPNMVRLRHRLFDFAA